MKRVAVTVDDREPAGLVAALNRHPDVESVAVDRLPAGDIVVGGVGVERKTPADFVRSAVGRTGVDLREQLRALGAAYDHAYLLVEGDFPELDGRGDNPAVVRGAVASLMARTDTPVVPCGDRERLVDLAVRLGRKHVEEPSPDPLSNGAVTRRADPTPMKMYGCIDGVGRATAENLYEAFPTVAELAAAPVEALREVEGVGEVRARAIREALRGAE